MIIPDLVFVVVLGLIAVTVTAFPLIYAFRGWRTTQAGRAMMLRAVSMMALVDISFAYVFVGDDYALRDVVKLGVFLAILAAEGYLLWTLVRSIHRARRR